MPRLTKGDAWCTIELLSSGATLRITKGEKDAEQTPELRKYQSPLKARWEHDLLIREQQDAGYALVGAPPPSIEREDFERLLEAPDPSDETHLIYGDWLQTQGDPRGELISVQHALQDRGLQGKQRDQLARREMVLLYQHRDTLLSTFGTTIVSPDAQRYLSDTVEMTWRLGFVEEVRTRQGIFGSEAEMSAGFSPRDLLEHMTASPSLRFLRRLFFGPFDGDRFASAAQALDEVALPKTLEQLELSGALDDYGRLLAALPQSWANEARFFERHADLRKLTLMDIDVTHPLKLPELQELSLRTTQGCADALAQGHLPKLKQLTLRGPWDGDADVERGMDAVLGLKIAPALEALHLYGILERGDQLFARLQDSPLAPKLKSLTISDCDLTDDGAAQIEGDNFGALESINVNNNLLSSNAHSALKARLKTHPTGVLS